MTVNVRVNELAKELGLTAKEIISHLEKMGITGKKAQSSITDDEINKVKNVIKKKSEKKTEEAGANKARIVAKIAGGAKMFEVSGTTDVGNVGERNAQASKEKLKALGIRLIAEDTGANYGRTVELNCANGEYVIKAVGKPIKRI